MGEQQSPRIEFGKKAASDSLVDHLSQLFGDLHPCPFSWKAFIGLHNIPVITCRRGHNTVYDTYPVARRA